MAFTLVHAGTVNALASPAAAITPVCTATTQHNLLVCGLALTGGVIVTGLSFPAGWVRAVHAADAGNATESEVWYYPDCPAGITSAAITWTGNQTGAAQILEFAGGATVSPLDRTGTAATITSTTTSAAIAASAATTAANELAVSVCGWDFASVTKATLAQGAGFTSAGSAGQGVKQNFHCIFDYNLDTGATGATPTDTVTDGAVTGTDGISGVIATFTLPAAPSGLLPQQLRQRAPLTIPRPAAGRADYGR